ncbi:ribbon-helix-helix domain-containing protein [Endobacter medicaginis]|nr:ribbon-helix-helix domain-containing protein [Endobacter medicaginis]MCX5476100.1 ribbon-helix-helix domain-containing protein [Endobacter medicaginis]
MPAAHLVKRSLTVAGHATSIALEAPFWAVLDRMAASRRTSLAALVAVIDAGRGAAPLTSSLRLAALAHALHDRDLPGETP